MLAATACSSSDAPAGPNASQTPPPVSPVAVQVQIETGGDSIVLGTTRTLVAKVLDRAGLPVALPVTWQSLTPAVVEIGASGTVTAIALGKATIVATSGAAADTAALVVRPLDQPLQISPDLIQIVEGDEMMLETRVGQSLGGNITEPLRWGTSDEEVAAVDSTGRLVAVAEGDVTLSVQMGSYAATASAVVVSSTVSSIKLSPSSITLRVGIRETIKATVLDPNGRTLVRTISWSSSDTSVASVSNSGQVLAKRPGFAIITAAAGGKKSSATVTVNAQPATSVIVSLASTSQAVGKTQTAKVVALDAAGDTVTGRPVAWNSSIPSVATVDTAGRIVARQAGKTRISAIVDAVVGYVDLTVFSPTATSLKITPSTAAVGERSTGQLTAVVLDQTGSPLASQPAISWSSAQPAVATVTSAGLVTGVAAGTATINAASGALTAAATVTVTPIAIASIQVTPAAPALVVSDSVALVPKALDASGAALAGRTFTFGSSAPAVASVSAQGVVQALTAGSATITVSSGSISKTVTVTVADPAVASIAVSLAQPALNPGQSTTASVTVLSVNGTALTPKGIAWMTSDAAIATVSSTGTVLAVGAGSATITATMNGVSGAATVTVAQPAALPVHHVTLTANSAAIAVNQGTQVVATVYDSLGNVLTGRTLAWGSSAASIAKVSASGFTTGVSAGTAVISASCGGKASSTPITVTRSESGGSITVGSVTVALSKNALTVGGSTSAIATVKDTVGNVLSGAAVTWSSSANGVATVSSAGAVTAVGAGSAVISASAGGLSGSATLTVSPASSLPVASVQVALYNAALLVGQTTQAVATAKDSLGNVVAGPSVTWSVPTGGSVASVSASGIVTALTAGAATVKATVAGVSSTASLVVSTPPVIPPQTGNSSVPLLMQRLTAGTGPVLVSNAIPLKPGMLFSNGLGTVSMWVNNVEVPIAVAATAGSHKDGSLRSVLVQTTYDVPAAGVGATLQLGAARTKNATLGTIPGVPLAVALPTDPVYLIATELVGPTLPITAVKALGGVWSRYENDFVKYADQHWALTAGAWSGNYYDRAEIYYAWWVRSGNAEYWRRATLIAVDYRTKYLEANNYGASHHWSQLEGLALHYWLTGDAMSQKAVGRTADILASYYRNNALGSINHPDMESRIQARSLLGMLLAWETQAPGGGNYTPATWATHLPLMLTQILQAQNANGAFLWNGYCGTSINYMNGILNDVMIRYYERFQADSRVLASVKANVDWLWATQWRSGGSFNYQSAFCARNNSGPSASPDLNGLQPTSFAWLYKKTGNSTYLQAADLIFSNGVQQAFLQGDKQFNQEYTQSYKYLFYRQ